MAIFKQGIAISCVSIGDKSSKSPEHFYNLAVCLKVISAVTDVTKSLVSQFLSRCYTRPFRKLRIASKETEKQ